MWHIANLLLGSCCWMVHRDCGRAWPAQWRLYGSLKTKHIFTFSLSLCPEWCILFLLLWLVFLHIKINLEHSQDRCSLQLCAGASVCVRAYARQTHTWVNAEPWTVFLWRHTPDSWFLFVYATELDLLGPISIQVILPQVILPPFKPEKQFEAIILPNTFN